MYSQSHPYADCISTCPGRGHNESSESKSERT